MMLKYERHYGAGSRQMEMCRTQFLTTGDGQKLTKSY